MLSLFGKPEVNVMEPLDDMSSTMYHVKQLERRRSEFDDVDSAVGPARPGIVLDYTQDGRLSLNVEFGA